jgi:hypothetical protein
MRIIKGVKAIESVVLPSGKSLLVDTRVALTKESRSKQLPQKRRDKVTWEAANRNKEGGTARGLEDQSQEWRDCHCEVQLDR